MKNAVICHGGGPTAVLNASLLGVVDEAGACGIKRLWAALGGLPGMIGVPCVDLRSRSEIAIAAAQPGSYIRSFRGAITGDDLGRFVEFCRRRDIHACFYTGGNGSMGTALRIAEAAKAQRFELRVVGIPKTVDNDICRTDHCPGFGSAARFVARAVHDIGLDQRALPSPVSIIEVMGRNTGWLAASALLARHGKDAPPHFIYVPENPFDPQEFLARVDRLLTKQRWVVGVVAEGLRNRAGKMIGASGGSARDAKGRVLAGNCSVTLAALITRHLKVRARSEKPGLLCRASTDCLSEVDWRDAYAAGQAAVQAAFTRHSGVMVALTRPRSGKYRCGQTLVPLRLVANKERKLDPAYLRRGLVTDDYLRYVKPLVGEMPRLPVYL